MKIDIYNQKAEKTGTLELPKKVFELEWSPDLVHQVVVSMQSNKRTSIAHAKTRAEVSGGGKKPWRQKGTGRARHGSIRSPIWVGGGVTHGPLKEKNYYKKINKEMKRKALRVALSAKARDGEILVLDDIKLEAAKTKNAQVVISSLGKIKGFEKLALKRKNRAEILLSGKNEEVKQAFGNLPGILINESRNLNILDALTYKYLIFTKEALISLDKVE